MSSKELTDEIAVLEPKRAELVEKLDALMAAYRPHLATMAETWIRREVACRIKDHAKGIAGMGIERVKTLKSKVEALIQSLPQIVIDETSNKSNWPHNRPDGADGSECEKNEPFFNKSFRAIISHIAGVWANFGLLGEPKGHAQCWERVGPDKFRYALNPRFEILNCDTLNQYAETLREYRALLSLIEAKKKEMVEAKAMELWDSA